MKRDSVSAYVHMNCDTHLALYESVKILDDPSISLVTYIRNGWTNQSIRISYSLKYKHSKKNSLQKNK